MREWLIPLFLLRNPNRGRHRRVLRALTYTVEALWRNAERSGVISPNMPSRIREELNPMIKR